MASLPILIFPTRGTAARVKMGGGSPQLHLPTAARQSERLTPQIQLLEQAFTPQGAVVRVSLDGAEPEKVIVLETVGLIKDFFNAVRRIPGMEWMAELDEEVESDEDFYRSEHQDGTLGARLFLIMSNRAALDEMLRLWISYQANPDQQFAYGFDKWRRLFEQLRSLRVWGYGDRLRDTGLLEDWRSAIQNGRDYVSFEAELWYRGTEERRGRASAEVTQAVIDAGGQVFTSSVFPEISYHGLLGQIPSAAAQQILESQPVRLLQCEEIMFVRPAGQTVSNPPEDEAVSFPPSTTDDLPDEGVEPRVALLDGLPLSNHGMLAGRLRLDDPDDWQADYLAAERNHGTAMASLIVHGDLGSHSLPLRRPVYVRPIMKPDSRDFRALRQESMPHDRLSIDLLHTAVRRLFEATDTEEAVAPYVRVINLSIGDPSRPLDGPISPFARMIDWLSWRYRVLFVISAGNALAARGASRGRA
jgi:hypothetical protein